jgi:hypothetical protein
MLFTISSRILLILNSNETGSNTFFGIPELDNLFPSSIPPVLELVSPPAAHHPSGAGKTSLLYLIIAHAILPSTFSSIPLSGQNTAIILFDPLHHFSVPRLAQVMLNIIVTAFSGASKDINNPDVKSLIATSLLHVHIFRPQSWSSLLTTLKSLPEYLFDSTRHKSIHRHVHSVILEDIDAFVWSIRNSTSASTLNSKSSLTAASAMLTSSLHSLTTTFSAGIVTTSLSTTPNSFRPAIPMSWPKRMNTTRLAVRRVEVLKFAPALSVEEAEAERGQRWDVVCRGRFEVRKVGVGVRDGEGFVFRVKDKGVEMERENVS